MNETEAGPTGKLRRGAATVAALISTLAIVACGGSIGGAEEDAGENADVAPAGEASGELVISNWPGYVDPGQKGTIAEYEKETGVKVDYIEDVNDNSAFFGKLQPQLDQGQSGDRSIFVVTDWMAKQMYDLGYLQNLDHENLPTVFDNMTPQAESSALDPERDYAIPWQSGMTGIWVNKAEAPEITSINDLFDPKYKGKVTFLTEMRDSVPLVMKADGIDPAEASAEEWQAAIDKIREAADSGQIRRFTGNDYTKDINSGNVVAAVGWSGDASLISNSDAEWVMPDEGCMLWTDNMVIPIGAPNPEAAQDFMNFVYEPEVQADITEWVTYIPPVDGVQDILADRDPQLAEQDIVFPDEEFTADCSDQVNPPTDATDELTESYQDVVAG
ncbi:spermidine/putrescine ABC transporter substrate-binding protein [Thermoleophilia bacterium SCSIO 60948]|nr:spermidine/putrescine ABC transporter substrate-binding protein [Thermoleophilia bacterium SCSIO 60948]